MAEQVTRYFRRDPLMSPKYADWAEISRAEYEMLMNLTSIDAHQGHWDGLELIAFGQDDTDVLSRQEKVF